MRLISALIAASLALVIFTGCEDEQESNLFKAQSCIDTATAATVNQCSTYIAGDTSERSYVLQCSIAFVSENITETEIVNALENIDNQASASDPTIAAMSALAMTDVATSTAALNVCTLSNSSALIALANFANIATATASLASILANPTEAALQNFLDTYNPATDASDLGNAVIASQDSLCNSTNGLMKGTETCDNINQAVTTGGGNPDAIADALISNINNPNN